MEVDAVKFRVIKTEGIYVPQVKFFLFWQSIGEADFEYDKRMHQSFLNLPDAVQFINELKLRKHLEVVYERWNVLVRFAADDSCCSVVGVVSNWLSWTKKEAEED